MKKINEQEVLAVISAALANMDSREGHRLVVRSFRRIPQTAPVWNIAGRLDRIQKKMN
ncbi:MAG: sodium pump decarboxylase subunit gamma [Clostridia bacterium]|nr:sodium pump decarboxylase subunit gamma [Clostridia bacterium]